MPNKLKNNKKFVKKYNQPEDKTLFWFEVECKCGFITCIKNTVNSLMKKNNDFICRACKNKKIKKLLEKQLNKLKKKYKSL